MEEVVIEQEAEAMAVIEEVSGEIASNATTVAVCGHTQKKNHVGRETRNVIAAAGMVI